MSAESDAYNPLAKQELGHTRRLIQQQRKSMVSFDAGLSDEEEKKFWLGYDSYRGAIKKGNNGLFNIISDFAEAQKSGKLTDEQALEITSRYLKIKQDRFKVKNAYIKNSGSSQQKGRALLSD